MKTDLTEILIVPYIPSNYSVFLTSSLMLFLRTYPFRNNENEVKFLHNHVVTSYLSSSLRPSTVLSGSTEWNGNSTFNEDHQHEQNEAEEFREIDEEEQCDTECNNPLGRCESGHNPEYRRGDVLGRLASTLSFPSLWAMRSTALPPVLPADSSSSSFGARPAVMFFDFWERDCERQGKLAVFFFYTGTVLYLLGTLLYMYAWYSDASQGYGSPVGVKIWTVFLSFAMSIGVFVALYMKDEPD